MKVLVCGSRDWTNKKLIQAELNMLPSSTTIIHGAARGADSIAGILAERKGFKVVPYLADWDTNGKAAGMIRNRVMLYDNPDIDLVLVFHNDLSNSKGSKDMYDLAMSKHIEIRVITERDD